MSLFRRNSNRMPGLNTASMPDLVFTVLFFFMIVTHLREVPVKVRYRAPQAQRLDKLAKRSAVSYIYIGTREGDASGKTVIQLNDRLATAGEIAGYISAERARMTPEDLQKMTVSIRADRSTPMAVIAEVKQALRQANALRVHYSADEKAKPAH